MVIKNLFTAVSVVALASASASASAATAAPEQVPNDASAPQVGGDIIVTAQKREEKLLDVPVPVTVLSSLSLTSQNQVRIQDYYTRIPGLSLTSNSRGDEKVISIRGINAGGGNPTVGIIVDDAPFGSTSSYAGGGTVPDIDPSDLARIEVLRGPQGTLYGASSLGGLVQFVTVDPSTSGISGQVSAGLSSVRNGNSIGTNFRGSVNVPLADDLAIRASAFSRIDPGYIDNTISGDKGVNRTHVAGGRFSALWKPAPDLSVRVSALVQDVDSHGSSNVDFTGLDNLTQSELPGVVFSKKHIEAYSGTIRGQIGNVDLVSVTGYSRSRISRSFDLSKLIGFLGPLSGFGANDTGFLISERVKTSKFSQEVRASASIGDHIDLLGGAFFTKEKSRTDQKADLLDVTTFLTAVPNYSVSNYPTTFREFAVFTDLTLKLNDRFDIQFGARQSWNRQTYQEFDAGPEILFSFGIPSFFNPPTTTKDHSFTYLITPRFRITPDVMVYGRVATGYRPGGPNPTSVVFNLPPSFGPDRTQNFELGLKGRAFEHRLGFALSAYHIKWSNIQLSVNDPASGSSFFANAAEAKSDGIEMEFDLHPWTGMTVTATGNLNHARLARDFPLVAGASGSKGDRLPYASKASATFGVDQQVPINDHATANIGGTFTYVGSRLGVFRSTRQVLPSYTQIDLHAGVDIDDGIAFNLFATNITDKRGLLSGGLGTYQVSSFVITQPRTFGSSVTKKF
jgi:iron complex outermembrane receptor protein